MKKTGTGFLAAIRRLVSLPRKAEPVRVAFDLERMGEGGANGGIKPHLYSFFRSFVCGDSSEFQFLFLAQPLVLDELKFLFGANADRCVLIPVDQGSGPASLFDLGVDLLYACFGVSRFDDRRVPVIGLMVDCLHRDLPDALPAAETRFRDEWFAEAIERSVCLHVSSHFTKERLRKHFGVPENRIQVTALAAHERLADIHPDQSAVARAGLKPGRYFIYPANFWPHKNHLALLRAYRFYLDSAKDDAWDLALTGDPGEGAEVLSLAKELSLDSRARFLGHVPEKDFAALLVSSGALYFPSRYEGFGIPITEAMSLGVPIACSSSGSLPEVAGSAATFFDPDSIDSMAAALHRIQTDDELRERLRENGRTELKRFSMPRLAPEFLTLLRDSIKAR